MVKSAIEHRLADGSLMEQSEGFHVLFVRLDEISLHGVCLSMIAGVSLLVLQTRNCRSRELSEQ